MNFLAHVYLSGNDPEVRVGNFMGDFVKGSQLDQYSEGIRKGILLHRQIDHFTDNHEVVKKSKERLRPVFRHYAPVIVDVFYDHFLARDWQKFCDMNLEDYTKAIYNELHGFRSVMPVAAAHVLTYMRRDNWLYNYRLLEGMRRALTGMSRRTTFESKMEQAIHYLEADYEAFAEEFHDFFPDLDRHANEYLQQL